MLYETAARAGEILALDVEDLDLASKRAVITGKGGHREYVFWASGTARLHVFSPGTWAGGAEDPCSSPTGDPTLSRLGVTNAQALAGAGCRMSGLPVFSNRQPVGGHSTNSAIPH